MSFFYLIDFHLFCLVFFSAELLIIIKERFFKDGKPVNSTVALNAGDFKTCGKAMGMSLLQGGPAPNFMSPDVASFLIGEPLSPSENQDPLLRTTSERVNLHRCIF